MKNLFTPLCAGWVYRQHFITLQEMRRMKFDYRITMKCNFCQYSGMYWSRAAKHCTSRQKVVFHFMVTFVIFPWPIDPALLKNFANSSEDILKRFFNPWQHLLGVKGQVCCLIIRPGKRNRGNDEPLHNSQWINWLTAELTFRFWLLSTHSGLIGSLQN